jgi:hypothetical protein
LIEEKSMKKFYVTIPETRQEVVNVLYEIEAESEEAIRDLIDNGEFFDEADYLETKDSRWGFDVLDQNTSNAEIEEIEDEKV